MTADETNLLGAYGHLVENESKRLLGAVNLAGGNEASPEFRQRVFKAQQLMFEAHKILVYGFPPEPREPLVDITQIAEISGKGRA